MNSGFKRTFAMCSAILALGSLPLSNAVGQSGTQGVKIAGVEVKANPEIAKLLPAKYRERGLRSEVNPPYMPLELVDESGKFHGMNIDIAEAVAARLGTSITYGRVKWDAAIPALQADKYDMVLGTMADTIEREKMVTFVNYAKYGISMIVRAGNPSNIASGKDLCGKRLAILQGWSPPDYFDSLSKACESRGKPAVTLARLPATADTLIAVRSGAADATYASKPIAISAAKDLEKAGVTVITPKGTPGGWNPQLHGLVVLKENEDLKKAFIAAVDSLLTDGTIKKIAKKYDMDDIVLDRVLVNGAQPDTAPD